MVGLKAGPGAVAGTGPGAGAVAVAVASVLWPVRLLQGLWWWGCAQGWGWG